MGEIAKWLTCGSCRRGAHDHCQGVADTNDPARCHCSTCYDSHGRVRPPVSTPYHGLPEKARMRLAAICFKLPGLERLGDDADATFIRSMLVNGAASPIKSHAESLAEENPTVLAFQTLEQNAEGLVSALCKMPETIGPTERAGPMFEVVRDMTDRIKGCVDQHLPWWSRLRTQEAEHA